MLEMIAGKLTALLGPLRAMSKDNREMRDNALSTIKPSNYDYMSQPSISSSSKATTGPSPLDRKKRLKSTWRGQPLARDKSKERGSNKAAAAA
jgi:hypothetical protein